MNEPTTENQIPHANQAADRDSAEAREEEILNAEDPTALYRELRFDHPAVTFYDRLSRFAHANKRIIYALLLFAIVVPVVAALRSTRPASVQHTAEQYFARFQANEPGTYSIGSSNFSAQYIEGLFDAVAASSLGPAGMRQIRTDSDAYARFVKDQFETDLLVHAALREGVLESPQSAYVIENAMRHAIADYYVSARAMQPSTNLRITVTDEEVRSYYDRNKDQYAKSGLTQAQTLGVIRRTLEQIRGDEQRAELRFFREKLLSAIKDRGGYSFADSGQQRP